MTSTPRQRSWFLAKLGLIEGYGSIATGRVLQASGVACGAIGGVMAIATYHESLATDAPVVGEGAPAGPLQQGIEHLIDGNLDAGIASFSLGPNTGEQLYLSALAIAARGGVLYAAGSAMAAAGKNRVAKNKWVAQESPFYMDL